MRRQPIAVLALLVALSGSAIAAAPRITGAMIQNGTVTGLDVKNSSLTSVDVKNGSLLAADFKPGQLPKGAKGDRGETGATGPQGPAGVSIGEWHVVGAAGEPATGAAWTPGDLVDGQLKFRLEGDVVRLAGHFAPSASYPGGNWFTANSLLFVLPAGYRPNHWVRIPVQSAAAGEPTHLFIGTDGAVYPRGTGSGFGHADGVTFPIT
jgi:hypothetical protein